MAKYRVFQRRSGVWYLQDRESGEQQSLRTRDKTEATRLLNAKNEAVYQPAAINLQLARAYICASDPKLGSRDWQEVMEQVVSMKHGETHRRWAVAIRDKNFDSTAQMPAQLVEGFALWILLTSDDALVFFSRDAALGFVDDFGPTRLG